MSRRIRGIGSWMAIVAMVGTGCQPTQPFFFMEDGDLSHYLDVATEIEFPDVNEPRLAEVDGAQAPLTIDNFDQYELWDLSLEEASRIMLANSQVMRELGVRVVSNSPEVLTQFLVGRQGIRTTYDPALVESGYGTSTGISQSGTGVEAALSEFDANIVSNVVWENNRRPQNATFFGFFAPVFDQDAGRFTAEINKATADGSQFALRNNTIYDSNNNPTRIYPSDWTTNIEASFAHPLLQGRGTQYNRIAGPTTFQEYNSRFVNPIDGVVIARIRHDLELVQFEAGVRQLVRDLENAYWDLYFQYRNLEAQKAGEKAAQATWKTINEFRRAGDRRGAAHEEGRARAQYYLFRSQVETALTDLLRAENRLRYIMGLSTSDGRLIRPVDEPTIAKVEFDWATSHCEALARRVEIRKQKWELKKRELELIAARNHLLPRLDAIGQYRWLGLGDDLIRSNPTGLTPFEPGSNAVEVLTNGDFQEWQLGLQFSMPLGNRRAHTAVRHHQLLIARARAILQDIELEISHQLADGIRDLDLNHRLGQTSLNRYAASFEEVRSYTALFEEGADDPVTNRPVTADVVLNAQRRQFEGAVAYYRALVDYNLAIARVHFRKGSLLDYNAVLLAEGPWPGKAQFDALRRARKRDASMRLDYGFTRPSVISRGPYEQHVDAGVPAAGDMIYEGPTMSFPEGGTIIPEEAIPTPRAEPHDVRTPQDDGTPGPTEVIPEPAMPAPAGSTDTAARQTSITPRSAVDGAPLNAGTAATAASEPLPTPPRVQAVSFEEEVRVAAKQPSPGAGKPVTTGAGKAAGAGTPYSIRLSNPKPNTEVQGRPLPAPAAIRTTSFAPPRLSAELRLSEENNLRFGGPTSSPVSPPQPSRFVPRATPSAESAPLRDAQGAPIWRRAPGW